MLANFLLASSGIILLFLCFIVYWSNSKRPVNRALAGFLISGFLWLAANFLANISDSGQVSLFFTRATLIGASLIPLSFLVFSITYTGIRRVSGRLLALLSAVPLLIIGFTPTSLNIESVGPHGRNVTAGPIYLLLLILLIIYFSAGIYMLAKYYRRAPTTTKSQLQYIFVGLLLTLIPGFITNGLMPILGLSKWSAYGPFVVIFFSLFTTLAIIRHRLLDIRLVIARSLAYALVLGTLGTAFALLVLTITSLFFAGDDVAGGVKATYITIALALAFAYQPLKRVFDKFTNRIFYRDAYDPQAFLDELNSALVGNIEIKGLLEKSSKIISKNIKADFCLIGVKEVEEVPIRIFGTTNKVFTEGQIRVVRNITTSFGRQKVVITDEIEDRHAKLREILQSHSIGALTRLLADKGGIGYIVLGYKKSGNPYSKQDIKMLDLVADELVIAIQNALRFEEISRFNITLRQRIDEATKELRAANKRLKALDQAKDEFISMASHQLRTPLTSVKGYLSMALEGDVGKLKPQQQEILQHAFDSSQRMVYLISDLLNVSRLQTGKFVIENKPTHLADVVEEEMAQLKEQAAVREITMSYKKPEHFPELNMDETKIRQVMMNFMDNALYYTPKGGNITIALTATDEAVTFTVTDTGVGVPKSVQHHLFTKFYRADNARQMRPDGTGLGLFMAKKVVVAQGGAIVFKSAEGKGSTFGFSFPRKELEVKAG